MSDWEEQIGEYANTLLGYVEDQDGARAERFLARLEPHEEHAVAVALAQALLTQEASNEAIVSRNALLEAGNVALFRERRELTDKLAEAREIRQKQGERLNEYRKKLEQAGVRVL